MSASKSHLARLLACAATIAILSVAAAPMAAHALTPAEPGAPAAPAAPGFPGAPGGPGGQGGVVSPLPPGMSIKPPSNLPPLISGAQAAPPVYEDPASVPAAVDMPKVEAPDLGVLNEINRSNADLLRLKMVLDRKKLESEIKKIEHEMDELDNPTKPVSTNETAPASSGQIPWPPGMFPGQSGDNNPVLSGQPAQSGQSAQPSKAPVKELTAEEIAAEKREAALAAEAKTLPGVYSISGLDRKLKARIMVKNLGFVDVEAGSTVPPGFKVVAVRTDSLTVKSVETGKTYDLLVGVQPSSYQSSPDRQPAPNAQDGRFQQTPVVPGSVGTQTFSAPFTMPIVPPMPNLAPPGK